jgi:hypothetical protein
MGDEKGMKKYALGLAFMLLILLGVVFFSHTPESRGNESCFSRVMVNVSDVKPPIVSGPGFPPQAGFNGITIDEVVNGSPRHVLVGFFNFRPSNWAGERPRCYFKALEGFSENWTGLILPGASLSNVTLSGRVYLALYVYPRGISIIISKVNYGETPEKSKITEAFRLKYTEPPGETVGAYISRLKRSGYTAVRELSGGLFKGWVFKRGNDYLLVLETRDEGNLYLLLTWGGEDDVKKLADSISRM